LTALFLATPGCSFDGDFSGSFRCDIAEDCPAGQLCADGTCRGAGEVGPIDAAAADPPGADGSGDGEADASDNLVVFERRVAEGDDDAEEIIAAGAVDDDSIDLELCVDDELAQLVGIRFTSVDIPPGAEILSAHLQFTVYAPSSATTLIEIRAEATDSAAAILPITLNLSARSYTLAAVTWTPPPWGGVGQAGDDQRTPNLAAVLGEVVGRPGWAAGNAVLFKLIGSGDRVAVAHDADPELAPLLRVEYRVP